MLREARESLDHGGELGDGAIGIDEEGKCILHAPECRECLHESAERHLACIVARGCHDEREYDREL